MLREDRYVMHLSCDAHDWKNLTESSFQINVIFGYNICKILLEFLVKRTDIGLLIEIQNTA